MPCIREWNLYNSTVYRCINIFICVLTGKMTSTKEKPATIVSDEVLRCFVCDVTVTGRYYTLATCRTQSTKIRLIEKLGQLVGERYVILWTACAFFFIPFVSFAYFCDRHIGYLLIRSKVATIWNCRGLQEC